MKTYKKICGNLKKIVDITEKIVEIKKICKNLREKKLLKKNSVKNFRKKTTEI